MTDGPTSSKALGASGWSNRILIATVIGILFLTLCPFRFDFDGTLGGRALSHPLDGAGKDTRPFDTILNILLFIPFGFALALKLRERDKSRAATLGIALSAGALFSLAVEFFQFYIPGRDSGWLDVLTNSTGSVAGGLLFLLCGRTARDLLSEAEQVLGAWLTLGRAVFILTLYCGLWTACSIPLQRETRLNDWGPDSLLLVGNMASGQLTTAWRGRVFQFSVWPHALPRKTAQDLTSGGHRVVIAPASMAAYDLSGPPPFQDQRDFLPDLVWVSDTSVPASLNAFALDGKNWLASRGPVSALVANIKETGQFALRVRCEPAGVAEMNGRIISISQPSGLVNLDLAQDGAGLIFWFRNQLSEHLSLGWSIPDVFEATQSRDLLFSYDGSDLSFYVDGKRAPLTYRLSPGVGLVQMFRLTGLSELEATRYIFYALVFLPPSILLGLVRKTEGIRPMVRYLIIVSAILIAPLPMEMTLARVSGREISAENIALSIFLMIGGLFLGSAPMAVPLIGRSRQ